MSNLVMVCLAVILSASIPQNPQLEARAKKLIAEMEDYNRNKDYLKEEPDGTGARIPRKYMRRVEEITALGPTVAKVLGDYCTSPRADGIICRDLLAVLGKLKSEDAIPMLVKIASDDDALANTAMESLVLIGTDKAMSGFLRVWECTGDNTFSHDYGRNALDNQFDNPDGLAAFDRMLKKSLKEKVDQEIVRMSLETLRKFKDKGKRFSPTIDEIIKEEKNVSIHNLAVETLRSIDPDCAKKYRMIDRLQIAPNSVPGDERQDSPR